MFTKPSFDSLSRSGGTARAAQAGTETLQNWMQSTMFPQSERTVSANEHTSLNALIAYVATKLGENEFRVERRLADRFKIANVMCLPAIEYDNAVLYLVNHI